MRDDAGVCMDGCWGGGVKRRKGREVTGVAEGVTTNFSRFVHGLLGYRIRDEMAKMATITRQ